MALTYDDFERNLTALGDFTAPHGVAAGVSGGPDSMALLFLLSQWGAKNNVPIHAYTIDHGLRATSADEARKVGDWVKNWPAVTHKILRWEGAKPETRILEEARNARYALMAGAMKDAGSHALFIAHHRDDQAETFLIRLAKGSGLDGLAGMRSVQPLEDHRVIVRPLLDWSKEDLISICNDNNIPYINDPTNENEHYLRPRLRAAREILEEEGLSAKRLAMTARRLSRAKTALEDFAHDLFVMAVKEQRDDGFLLDYKALHAAHEELVVRVLLHVMDQLRPDADYAPRMEKLENLLERIFKDPGFNGATLGGCLFALNRKNETLWVGKE